MKKGRRASLFFKENKHLLRKERGKGLVISPSSLSRDTTGYVPENFH